MSAVLGLFGLYFLITINNPRKMETVNLHWLVRLFWNAFVIGHPSVPYASATTGILNIFSNSLVFYTSIQASQSAVTFPF